jgi:putative DNA primase/helicase
MTSCPVPSHGKGRGDRNCSVRVGDGQTRLLVRCYAGCDPHDVHDELQRRGLLPERNSKSPWRELLELWRARGSDFRSTQPWCGSQRRDAQRGGALMSGAKGGGYKVYPGPEFLKERGHGGPKIEVGCISEVDMKEVDWLWEDHLARGKITMLAGDSALGKSQISIKLAAAFTNGSEWPDNNGTAPIESVIFITAEDAIDDTVAPRLVAAGANTDRVHYLKSVHVDGKPRSFNIQTNMDAIARKVRELGDVAMVVIDPITAFLGGGNEVDTHRVADVRAALLPLEQFAAELHVAVLCITHPPKSPSTKSLNFIAGSGAFTHAPRLVFMVIEDPELPGRNLMLAVKNTLSRKADGIGYGIISRSVGPNDSIHTSVIEWDSLPVRMNADEVLIAHAEKRKAKAQNKAEDFLRTQMHPGQSYAAADLKKQAENDGIGESTLDRASRNLGIKKSKNGFGGQWWWQRNDN